MAESITREQLREMREEGDELEFHDTGRRSIEGFTELVKELRALVEAQRANAAADMLRSETQSEIVTALQGLLSRPASAVDLTPLRDIMTEMQMGMESRPKTGYEFLIDRDGQGFMRKITATPMTPTIN